MLVETLNYGIENGDEISYEEYKAIEKNCELKVEYIDGKIYYFAGGITLHNVIINKLSQLIGNKIKDGGKDCISAAEFAWYYKENDRDLVIYPDVAIVCDWKEYLNEKYLGKIKFVIEVLSESTKKYDRGIKLKKYRKLGVEEYILVDIENKSLEIFCLKDIGAFGMTAYLEHDEDFVFESSVYKELKIGIKEVFEGI